MGGQSSIYSRRLLTCFHSSIRPSIPAPSNAIPFPKPVINSAGLCSCCLPHPVSQSNGQPTFLREGFGKQMEARGGRERRKERLAHSPCCRVFPRYFGSSFPSSLVLFWGQFTTLCVVVAGPLCLPSFRGLIKIGRASMAYLLRKHDVDDT